MATSPSHKLGQQIGDLLEETMYPLLQEFCNKHGLFLDKKGERQARSGRKVTWEDKHGNKHDLDFVIERGGTSTNIGHPVAFIEAAWRRYTKHSRNKTQEIQGAILPIVERYTWDNPFIGAILAGVFTEPSLQQMESLGFTITLFSYNTIIKAFESVDVDIQFDEKTSEDELSIISNKISSLDQRNKEQVKKELVELNRCSIKEFFVKLEKALNKKIDKLGLIPLHGKKYEFDNIETIIEFIKDHKKNEESNLPLISYDIYVRYNNGSEIRSTFKTKDEIFIFLDYISKSISS